MIFLVFCHSKEHVCGNAGPAKPVSPSHRGVLFPLLGLKFPLLTSGRIIPHSLYFLRPLEGLTFKSLHLKFRPLQEGLLRIPKVRMVGSLLLSTVLLQMFEVMG